MILCEHTLGWLSVLVHQCDHHAGDYKWYLRSCIVLSSLRRRIELNTALLGIFNRDIVANKPQGKPCSARS